MATAWVLERARAGQGIVHDVESRQELALFDPIRRRVPGRLQGPLKYRFTDKHQQASPRYPLPHLQQRVDSDQQPQHANGTHQQQQKLAALQSKHKALAARLAAVREQQQRRQQQQQQQRHSPRHGCWSPKVADDIRVVCAELQLPQSVATALCAAAAKGQVSCNPGILLSQLLRLLPLQPELSQLLGRENSLAVLLSAQPALLQSDPQSLQANCRHLPEVLGREAAAAAARRCPQILSCTPFRVATNLAMLQELLGYSSPAAAAAVAVRQPLLLLCSPDNLRMRCQQLQQLLSAVPADKLSKQLRRTPELLLMRPITLAAKLKCLELLLVPPTAGGQMAAAGPSAAAGETVLNAAAGSIAGPDKDQQPEMQGSPQQPTPSAADQQQQRLLHAYHQQELSYRLQRLQAAAQARLHTSTNAASSSSSSSSSATAPRVQHLALKVPGLLSLQPATLQSHVLELQLLLGLQADDPRLTRMVLLQPGLLTQSPKTLAHKLQLLQDLTGRPEAYAHGMVLRCPAVLTLSADSVTAKWGLLQRCVAACGTWQQELTAAPAVSVAMMLCYSIRRLQRLQYVLQLSQQQQREELQRASCTPDDAQPNPVEEDGMLSSSGSSRRRQRRSRQAAAAAPGCGKPPASQQHQQQQQQQHQSSVQQLPELPWKSLIQEADSTFCRRFPGFRAWLQQQPAEQQQQPADQQQLPPARPGARAAVAARQLAAVA